MFNKKYNNIFLVFFIICFVAPICLFAQEVCIYVDDSGAYRQVESRSKVPASKRSKARCYATKKQDRLAAPDEVDLKGTVRKVDMASSVGRIDLRWPRKVETLFGRTPQRAVADAARTVSRTLKSSGFSTKLRTLNLDWKIVFLDEDLPETQIPSYLVTNCHPAWMTPPANIYVVAQRVVAGCGGRKGTKTSVADSDLAEVLLHEMGHSVEYQLLPRSMGRDRARSEGFATWFEQYSAERSAVISSGSVKKEHFALAKASFRQSPNRLYFQGSAYDYARASLYFHLLVKKRQVRGLMKLYENLAIKPTPIAEAVRQEMNLSDKKLNEELVELLK